MQAHKYIFILAVNLGFFQQSFAQESKDGFALLDGKSLREKIDDFEKQLLQQAYKHSKGNVSRMARLLKTDRANLHRKLARYGIR